MLIDVSVMEATASRSPTTLQTRWRDGGRFVIKGTRTLDQDMAAALRHALMPEAATR